MIVDAKYQQLTSTLSEAENIDSALDFLLLNFEDCVENEWYISLVANVMFARGHHKDQFQVIDKLCESRSEKSQLFKIAKCRIALMLGDRSMCLEGLAEIFAEQRFTLDVASRLAELAESLEQNQAAKELANLAISHNKNNVPSQLVLFRLALREKEFGDAIYHLQMSKHQGDFDPSIYRDALGLFLSELNFDDYSETIEDLFCEFLDYSEKDKPSEVIKRRIYRLLGFKDSLAPIAPYLLETAFEVNSALEILSSQKLLISLLSRAPVTSSSFEEVITALRAGLVKNYLELDLKERSVPLLMAVGVQCSLTGFIFPATQEEEEIIDSLANSLHKSAATQDIDSFFKVLMVAMYRPIFSSIYADRLEKFKSREGSKIPEWLEELALDTQLEHGDVTIRGEDDIWKNSYQSALHPSFRFSGTLFDLYRLVNVALPIGGKISPLEPNILVSGFAAASGALHFSGLSGSSVVLHEQDDSAAAASAKVINRLGYENVAIKTDLISHDALEREIFDLIVCDDLFKKREQISQTMQELVSMLKIGGLLQVHLPRPSVLNRLYKDNDATSLLASDFADIIQVREKIKVMPEIAVAREVDSRFFSALDLLKLLEFAKYEWPAPMDFIELVESFGLRFVCILKTEFDDDRQLGDTRIVFDVQDYERELEVGLGGLDDGCGLMFQKNL